MKRPDVPKPRQLQQRRTWTDDQRLIAVADAWGSGSYEDAFPDASPEVIEYALHMLGEERRSLLALLAASRGRSVTCGQCGETFVPIRSTATYCSGACRQAAHRARAESQRNGAEGGS